MAPSGSRKPTRATCGRPRQGNGARNYNADHAEAATETPGTSRERGTERTGDLGSGSARGSGTRCGGRDHAPLPTGVEPHALEPALGARHVRVSAAVADGGS